MSETLSLDLDAITSSQLYILLDAAIDSLNYKKAVLEKLKTLPLEQRDPPLEDADLEQVIKLNLELINQAQEFSKETAQIILELENTSKKPIITKPNF